jgi:hypothetical protein
VEVILFNHLMQERWKRQTEQWKEQTEQWKGRNRAMERANRAMERANRAMERILNSSSMANRRIYNLRIIALNLVENL